ncbi:hypothetical protein TNCV_4000781 [Trichonephila clavipes]|nr:hypothetical protein TNCV_4000781 [Trichonephila clavipes]
MATHVVAGCHGHTTGLSWCHGSILAVTVYCRHLIPSHQLWERCVAVKQRQIEAFTTGSPDTNTIVITASGQSRTPKNNFRGKRLRLSSVKV